MSHPNTILVVNDDANFAEALAALLRSHGYQVVTALGVREGLARALEHRPALVLTDFNLGGDEDAVDLLGALDEYGFDSQVPRFVITGEQSTVVESRLASEGVEVPVFRKLTDLGRLMAEVNRACNGTQPQPRP